MRGGPPRLVDPRSNEAYVFLPLTEYEAVREIVEDERRQGRVPVLDLDLRRAFYATSME